MNNFVIFRNISCFKSRAEFIYNLFDEKKYIKKLYLNLLNLKELDFILVLIAKIKIFPSLANTGIIFKRIDLTKNNLIKGSYHNVPSARLCTTLENSFGVKVSTVEHLLAALYIKEYRQCIN